MCVHYTTLFFDLDDTLYPSSSGLWAEIRRRIGAYMHERLGIPAEQIDELRKAYYEQYGTALRGLQVHYPIDVPDFLAYVHDLPLADYIQPDPQQRATLQAIPARKVIFTNSDSKHVGRVLRALALEDCFEAVVDIVAVDPYCKPMRPAFEIAMKTAGESDARRCVLIDDMPRSTRAARELGMFSILYGRNDPGPDAEAAFCIWTELPRLLENHNHE